MVSCDISKIKNWMLMHISKGANDNVRNADDFTSHAAHLILLESSSVKDSISAFTQLTAHSTRADGV